MKNALWFLGAFALSAVLMLSAACSPVYSSKPQYLGSVDYHRDVMYRP